MCFNLVLQIGHVESWDVDFSSSWFQLVSGDVPSQKNDSDKNTYLAHLIAALSKEKTKPGCNSYVILFILQWTGSFSRVGSFECQPCPACTESYHTK